MFTVIVEDEILISKVPAFIWSLLTDISRWSRLNRIIRHAAIYGPLEAGTEFKFISGKWDFDGIIIQVTPQSAFAFDARSIGLRLRFEWEISEQVGGAKVKASIQAGGPIASLFKGKTKQLLEDGLFTWLYALKTTLERGEKRENTDGHGVAKQHRKHAGPGPFGFLFKHHHEE